MPMEQVQFGGSFEANMTAESEFLEEVNCQRLYGNVGGRRGRAHCNHGLLSRHLL